MSIMRHVLEDDASSSFTLVYGNRNRNSIIFREAIEGLKNRFMNRLSVYHVLSRELMDVNLFNGRIDALKCSDFCTTLIDIKGIDEAFLCGPEDMILSVREQLVSLGMPAANIHLELFSSPDQPKRQHEQWKEEHTGETGPVSKVSVRLDGVTFELDLPYSGDNILDAALAHGADLPYACKGGVCSTCRAKVTEGEVVMEVNYALEPDEIAKGFILTCQSHPKTERVVVDFDAR
jgi:ring-1,2-phenylacetyl-CoA epoxidase subunit PaaE